jgi:hypothetical protein
MTQRSVTTRKRCDQVCALHYLHNGEIVVSVKADIVRNSIRTEFGKLGGIQKLSPWSNVYLIHLCDDKMRPSMLVEMKYGKEKVILFFAPQTPRLLQIKQRQPTSQCRYSALSRKRTKQHNDDIKQKRRLNK